MGLLLFIREQGRLVAILALERRQPSGRAEKGIVCVFRPCQSLTPIGWIGGGVAPQYPLQVVVDPICPLDWGWKLEGRLTEALRQVVNAFQNLEEN